MAAKLHYQNMKINVRKAKKKKTCICIRFQKKNLVSISPKSPSTSEIFTRVFYIQVIFHLEPQIMKSCHLFTFIDV